MILYVFPLAPLFNMGAAYCNWCPGSVDGDGEFPCAAVRNLEDVFDNPRVLAEELVTTMENPLAGPYRGLTWSIKFSRMPRLAPFVVPVFGQHTDAIHTQTACGGSPVRSTFPA